MFRTLTAAAVLAALSTVAASSALAQTAPAKARPKAKATAKKPAAEAAPATDDNLNPGQLTVADRVLTGTAECEFRQKVSIEKIEGHQGNFKVTFDRKSYVMVPEETTTGAIRLVDTGGTMVWIQIPVKSMLMNQKEHHRLVDNCQADEQRVAVQATQKAGTNAAAIAPNVAPPGTLGNGPAAINAAVADTAAPGSTVTTTQTTTTTVTTKVTPPAPANNGAAAPSTTAPGMWK